MATHVLKTWPASFKDVAIGGKNFEVRRDDRDFQTGDTLRLVEWSPEGYTGRAVECHVTYLLPGGQFGIEDGYVVMGLADSPVVLDRVRDLHNEVDCRIEHGADSGGHLEYVRDRLAKILDSAGERAVSPSTGRGASLAYARRGGPADETLGMAARTPGSDGSGDNAVAETRTAPRGASRPPVDSAPDSPFDPHDMPLVDLILKAKRDGFPYACIYCGAGLPEGGDGDHFEGCTSPAVKTTEIRDHS